MSRTVEKHGVGITTYVGPSVFGGSALRIQIDIVQGAFSTMTPREALELAECLQQVAGDAAIVNRKKTPDGVSGVHAVDENNNGGQSERNEPQGERSTSSSARGRFDE